MKKLLLLLALFIAPLLSQSQLVSKDTCTSKLDTVDIYIDKYSNSIDKDMARDLASVIKDRPFKIHHRTTIIFFNESFYYRYMWNNYYHTFIWNDFFYNDWDYLWDFPLDYRYYSYNYYRWMWGVNFGWNPYWDNYYGWGHNYGWNHHNNHYNHFDYNHPRNHQDYIYKRRNNYMGTTSPIRRNDNIRTTRINPNQNGIERNEKLRKDQNTHKTGNIRIVPASNNYNRNNNSNQNVEHRRTYNTNSRPQRYNDTDTRKVNSDRTQPRRDNTGYQERHREQSNGNTSTQRSGRENRTNNTNSNNSSGNSNARRR